MPLTVFSPFFHRFVDQIGKRDKENWCLDRWRSCKRYQTTNFFRFIRWCWNRTRNKRRKQDLDGKRLLKSHPQRLLWSAQTIWRYAPDKQPRAQGFSSSLPLAPGKTSCPGKWVDFQGYCLSLLTASVAIFNLHCLTVLYFVAFSAEYRQGIYLTFRRPIVSETLIFSNFFSKNKPFK